MMPRLVVNGEEKVYAGDAFPASVAELVTDEAL